MFSEDFIAVKDFTNTRVGVLKNDISTRDAYFGSSEFIDMIHSIQLEVSDADISFAAPLSFDVSKQAGELIYQDLSDIYPYENQLYVIEMKGDEVKNYLEYSYSKWIFRYPSESGHLLQIKDPGSNKRSRFNNVFFNFDSAAGILYEVDITQDYGKRIKILSMADGSEFVIDSTYKVALSSYRASGGGDLLVEGAGIPKEELEERRLSIFPDIRQLLYDKFDQDDTISAVRLNHWRFVPESLAEDLIIQDYRTLFPE
jgi:2',3'-cyclic-nucleotide 2'-phosphodiesterase/3'-nucleotidase